MLSNQFSHKSAFLFMIIYLLVSSCGGDEETPSPDIGNDNESLPISINMVALDGGGFSMGDPNTSDAPEVSVTLSAFSISDKEITNAQYLEFLNAANEAGWLSIVEENIADPCGMYLEYVVKGAGSAPNAGQIFLQLGKMGVCTSDGHTEHIDNKSWIAYDQSSDTFSLIDNSKSNWPINWVRWYGAFAFTEFYNVSLPTEAQWEYAARGGQQLNYPTNDGSLSAAKANYNGDLPGVYNPDGHSVATGTYPANPYGLYDMAGNVWEWCLDYYSDSFYSSGTTDPVNETPGSESRRVRRGGSWNYHAATLTTYARASDLPERGNNHFGFRIVSND